MRVSNLEETVDFYQKVFGLEVSRRHQSPRGSQLVFLAVPNSEEEIELTYFPGSGAVEVQEDLMHLAFEVEDMNNFAQHIKSVGYKFRAIINQLSWSLSCNSIWSFGNTFKGSFDCKVGNFIVVLD